MEYKLLAQLQGGDLRSEGNAEIVAGEILNDPTRLEELKPGLASEDRLLRARTCMALEIISRSQPELLNGLLPDLVELSARDTVPQVRWHLAEIFTVADLTETQQEALIPILLDYLEDRSRIVKYCAVTTLGVVAVDSPQKRRVRDRIRLLAGESKSMARAVDQSLENLSET